MQDVTIEIINEASTQATQVFCSGLEWPSGINYPSDIPFQLISDSDKYSYLKLNSDRIHHKECWIRNYTLIKSSEGIPLNKCCEDIQYNKSYNELVSRAQEDTACRVNNKYLTMNQLISKIRKLDHFKDTAKLDFLNKNRRYGNMLKEDLLIRIMECEWNVNEMECKWNGNGMNMLWKYIENAIEM